MKKIITKEKLVLLLGLLVVLLCPVGAAGSVAYLTAEGRNPWGISSEDPGSNEAAMDRVFGDDGWENLRFETVDANSLFSSEYSFIFLEGGDGAATGLENFLTANGGLIEDWVRAGGRLFINAAPNEGGSMNLGFDLSLNYSRDTSIAHSYNASAVDPNHVIFDGNYGNAGGTFSGNWFSHATVSGEGLNSLITGDVGVILGEKTFGEGGVLVGGMTLPHYHNPSQESYDLLANILDYAAHGTIPEPSTYALWAGAALAGVALVRRRQR